MSTPNSLQEKDEQNLNPMFEAFAVWLSAPRSPAYVATLVADVIGENWRVAPIPSDSEGFEIFNPNRALSEQEAWESTYALRALTEILAAEPLFQVAAYEDLTVAERQGLEAAEHLASHKPGTERAMWALDLMQVPRAIDGFFGGDPEAAGAGVVVGHPDTGYHRHPEILDKLLLDKGYDFVTDDGDALDDLLPSPEGLLENPSHGVGTSSVIISGWRDQPDVGEATGVQGVAPGARLIPLRCTRTVVLISMRNLARAIEFAVDQGSSVLSVSLGGVPSRRLYQAIRYAEKNGVIVCAAAGNQVRFTVWPANYGEVVACAACSIERKPWSGSSRGRAVDVTAPGESIWRARVERDAENGNISNHLGRGAGTSYAVAHVAGAAALWLSHHGRDALLARYGPAKLPSVFRSLVATSCTKEPGLGSRYGAGLLNVDTLLASPLPGAGGLESLMAPEPEADPITEFARLFDVGPAGGLESEAGPTSADLRRVLADLIRTPEAGLNGVLISIGDELLFHLMTRPDDFDRLRAATVYPGGLESAGREASVAQVREDIRRSNRSHRLHTAVSS